LIEQCFSTAAAAAAALHDGSCPTVVMACGLLADVLICFLSHQDILL
jgi:hypothetical protein